MTVVAGVDPASASRGVVTACDANYFPGLLALYASVQASAPCPLLCYDLGLTSEQRIQAARQRNLVRSRAAARPANQALIEADARRPAAAKPGKRVWPLWICPLLIRAAPFHDVVWLDCDLLVLRGLDELFARLDTGPAFTPELHAPELTPNRPELYRLLPIRREFDPSLPVVNAGVSAWRRGRDDAALDAYVRPVEAAARDRAVRAAIAWWDQGALIWAIQSLGLEHRVLSPVWNLPVGQANLAPEALVWDDGLLARLQVALPDVRIVHWNGRPAPWI